MPITQTDLIEIRWTSSKGRGVFAREFIARDTVFERAPVLVMPDYEVLGTEDDTVLSHYLFEWGKGTVALALGFGSLYNHSYSPNARYEDGGRQVKLYIAVRDIEPGEEITINYNGSAENTDPVWFDVIENRPKATRNGSRRDAASRKAAGQKAAAQKAAGRRAVGPGGAAASDRKRPRSRS